LIYQEHGEGAFSDCIKKNSYTKEFKKSVVESHINGDATITELCVKHNIHHSTLGRWIQRYYNGMEQTDYYPKREDYTMVSGQSTFEKRLEIVKWVMDNDMNYNAAAKKYQVKYQAVYSWVRKYRESGAEALEYQRRGPKVKKDVDKSKMSESELLKYELDQEKALRKQLELELEILKKKEEFEKSLRYRK
jgi:transposase-like protein